MKIAILITLLLAISNQLRNSPKKEWPIKKVIYMMLENRAFDHMLGSLS